MTRVYLTEPLYYYALFALAIVVLAVWFWFIYWSISTDTRKIERRLDVLDLDPEERFARLCWTYLRETEGILAHTLAMARAVREHPERIAALLAENPVRLHVVDDDRAAI